MSLLRSTSNFFHLDSLLTINAEVEKHNIDGQPPITVLEEDIMKEDSSSPPIECQTETTTNLNNDLLTNQQTNQENSSIMRTNPFDSNSLLSSSFASSSSSSPPPPLISISPSTLTLTTNEKNISESLPREKEEEEKKEEEQHCNDDHNLDAEKKNNSSFVYDYHASGIILINDEPTQTALLEQEKREKEDEEEERERPSSPLPTLEQFTQQRTEDESPIQTLSNDLNQMAMTNMDENEERYKKVEIEEIPDDEEEAVSTDKIDVIEPTDFIRTDDEPSKNPSTSSSQPTNPINNDDLLKFDQVFSCYEKALAKVVDTPYDESSTTTTSQTAEDPIALRALKRFEERMNAAVAAKTTKEEPSSLAAKGKSSWSGSLSTPRKSMENLFKSTEHQQQLRSTPVSAGDESSLQSDGFIRPRKTFDDHNLNYGTTNLPSDKPNDDDGDHKIEEQLQPSAIVDNADKRGERRTNSCLHIFFSLLDAYQLHCPIEKRREQTLAST